MHNHPFPARRLLAACSLAFATVACGDFADQLQAEDFAVAALVKTPDQENPQTKEVIPGVTTMTLFFGHVDKSKLVPRTDDPERQEAQAGAFVPNAGATVTLEFDDPASANDVPIGVPHRGDGKYFIDSSEANRLVYAETEYTLKIDYSGRTFRMKVTPPKATEIAEFKAPNPKIIQNHPAGQPFTVTRAGGSDDPLKNPIAFLALQSADGASASEAWTNVPKDALGFLRLVLDDTPWRQKTFTIPGDQFKANEAYVVVLTAVERGLPASGETAPLFLGSSFLAGVADGGGILAK